MNPKVYQGGIPGTYGSEMSNAGFNTSGEGEMDYVPGHGEAPSPRRVSEGGNGGGKTYDKNASEDFLGSSSYQAFGMAACDWTGLKTDVDNPDDISRADHNDDSDLR